METFGTPAPKRQTIYRIRDKFDTTGSILNIHKTGRPKTVCIEEFIQFGLLFYRL